MTEQIITVDFRDDTLFAVDRGNGAVFVAIAPICKTLGIDPSRQRQRIQDDPILGKGSHVMSFPSPGGAQDTVVLRLDLLNGWLFGINASRVRPDVRPKLIEYQRECHRVLFEHFYHRARQLPGERADKAWTDKLTAVRLTVAELRRAYGPRRAAELAVDLWARVDIIIDDPLPPQGELNLEEDSNVIDIRKEPDNG
jgi:hypothetical protein